MILVDWATASADLRNYRVVSFVCALVSLVGARSPFGPRSGLRMWGQDRAGNSPDWPPAESVELTITERTLFAPSTNGPGPESPSSAQLLCV